MIFLALGHDTPWYRIALCVWLCLVNTGIGFFRRFPTAISSFCESCAVGHLPALERVYCIFISSACRGRFRAILSGNFRNHVIGLKSRSKQRLLGSRSARLLSSEERPPEGVPSWLDGVNSPHTISNGRFSDSLLYRQRQIRLESLSVFPPHREPSQEFAP